MLRGHSKDQIKLTLKTGGLLTQVNKWKMYWGVWKGGLLTQVVLRTGLTVWQHLWMVMVIRNMVKLRHFKLNENCSACILENIPPRQSMCLFTSFPSLPVGPLPITSSPSPPPCCPPHHLPLLVSPLPLFVHVHPPWLRQIITPIFPNVIMLSLGGERLTPKVLNHYLHPDLGMQQLLWCFVAHLLIVEYPDHHQSLINSLLYYLGPLRKISSQSVHNFQSNVVQRQTDRQTNQHHQQHNLLCQEPPLPRWSILQTIHSIFKCQILQHTS